MGASGNDWHQILAIIVACIPGLTSAMIYTWTAPFLLILTQDKKNYNITEEEANLLPVLGPLALMGAAIFFHSVHDVIGRKYTLLILNIPQALFWIITIFAKDIYTFWLTRLLAGIGDAIMFSALPIYIGEVTTPRIRGTWGNGQTFSFNAGFLLINILGSYLTIAQTAYVCLPLPIISAILFLWMPETPYYYIMKGENKKARESLKWLTGKDDIESDFQQLKADVERQISETGSWMDIFKIRSNRRALTACIFIRASQQLAGISVVEGYFQTIIQKSGSAALSPEISAIIFSGFLWFVMSGYSVTLDRFGRRKSFMYSALGCAAVLLCESIFFYIDEFHTYIDLSYLQWIPIFGFGIYVIFYCGGLGILPSLMAGELFSTSIKGKALAICNVALGAIVSLCTYIFKSMMGSIGLYSPFFVFSICTFISFALSYYIVPETKGKTLEQIQQDLKANKIK